jgi:YVTN family beta-propeller protein
LAVLASCLAWVAPQAARAAFLPQPGSLSPAALAAAPDGTRLYIACAAANEVAVFDVVSGAVTKYIAVPHTPSGLALSSDGARL